MEGKITKDRVDFGLENDSPSRGRKWKINRQSQQETVNFGINQYCIVFIN